MFLSSKKVQRVRQQRKHADILQVIRKVQTSISLALEFNNIRVHQEKRIPDQLLDRPSQINIKYNVLEKLLVKEEWKHNVSTKEALPHEVMICKASGRKMTGGIGKEVRDERIRRNMREFLAKKGSMKRITFDLVD